MAEQGAVGLGKTPEALAKREVIVELSDGKTVVVHKWSHAKQIELLPLVGLLSGVPAIAEQSVAEADRERVRALEFDDLLEISTKATALNVTERTLKNLPTLLDQRKGILGALGTEKKAPSSLS